MGTLLGDEPTLSDVARRSGVSAATASRALNGREGVNPEVRERVSIVAKAMGYRPNRAAQNLAGGRSSVIGLVVGNTELLYDVYGVSMLQAVATAADQHDEGLMLVLDSKKPTEAVNNLISDGLIDGVLISAVAIGEGWIEELLDAKVPTILIGSHPTRSDVPVIDVDNRDAAFLAVSHLLDRGHRRIAVLCGPTDRVDTQQRLAGYEQALTARGITPDRALIVDGSFSLVSGYEMADDLFALEPDAIFAMNDQMARGIVRRAGEVSIAIPAEISIVGFDATSTGEPLEAPISSMTQPFEEIAELGVRSLIDLIEGRPVPRQQFVRSKLIDMGSVLPRPDPPTNPSK